MKKNDKLIVIFGVVILVLAAIGIYYWSPVEEELETMGIKELADVSGVFSNKPTAISVDDSDPFYALIATPVAVNYNTEGDQFIIPLYVKNDKETSRAIERAEEMIGIYSNYEIGCISAFGKSLKDISLEVVEELWESSEAVLLIEDSQEGYNLGLLATPIASYLSIPVIVTDEVCDEVDQALEDLGVTSSIVCGDLEGFGKVLKFETADDIVNASIELVMEKFGELDYVTIANPRDITEPMVYENDTVEYHFEYTISSSAMTPVHLVNMLTGAPPKVREDVPIPEGFKYAKVSIDAKGIYDENPDDTGAYLAPQFRGPENEILGFVFTIGGKPERGEDGKIETDQIHWETIIYDQPGEYGLVISGAVLTGKTLSYEIDVKVENIDTSLVPLMKDLSSVAPYLTAYHKGIVFAKPEFAFAAHESIVENPPKGVVYPCSNPELIEFSNEHTFEVHNQLNKVLAKIQNMELETEEDLEQLKEIYDDEPIYIALVGDAAMIPQYYYYDTEDANSLYYGWDIATDHIYGNIDPVPRDDKITIFANDEYSDYPHQENIVGRITGWDVQDACALITRTIFYDEVIRNMEEEEWKESALVQTGSGTDFQRIPGFDLIRKIAGVHELPAKWPTGEAHFENVIISGAISEGGFDIKSTENMESMRVGFSSSTLNQINKLGLLNRFLWPKLRVQMLAGENKVSGEEDMENSNFIFTFAHGQPMGFGHADVQIDSLSFRPVILNNLVNRAFPNKLLPAIRSGLGRLGAYSVRHVENMDFGPSVMMVESCYIGRIDGLYPENAVSQAFLHSGVNAFIASSRGTPGPGYLDARKRPVGLGISEFIKTTLNPSIQEPHFSALHAVNIFTDLTENDADIGTAFRNAKNMFMEDINSTFFWTPPLSLWIQTEEDLDMYQRNIKPTSEDDARCFEKKYGCLLEYNLFGDPAFNPYEPRNEGRYK